MAKYWLAENPNCELTDAEAQIIHALKDLTVTPAELNEIAGADLGAAEIAMIDGAVAGTQAAGKVVVANADVNIGVVKATELHIGASGSEVQVDATPAELNILDDATLTTAELNRLDDSAEVETIDSGVAVSIAKKNTKIDNTGTGAGAITLAAPDATMLGKIKTIEMTVDNGDVTMALTEVVGGSAGTTATFDAVGETLVLLGLASKWLVLNEYGVTLS